MAQEQHDTRYVDNSTESTSFGFRKSLALPCIFNSYLEYSSTIKCSEMSADNASREGTFLNIPFNDFIININPFS